MLNNAFTYAGNQSFNSPNGASETGHTSNGYARITFLAFDLSAKIRVNLNSSIGSLDTTYVEYNYGDELGELPVPSVIDDYTFVGWFTTPDFNYIVSSSTKIFNTTTLYAKFVPNEINCDSMVNSVYSYDYTGNQDYFIAYCPGTYKVEA